MKQHKESDFWIAIALSLLLLILSEHIHFVWWLGFLLATAPAFFFNR